MKKILLITVTLVQISTHAMAGARSLIYYDPIRQQGNLSLKGSSPLPYDLGFRGFVDIFTARGDQRDSELKPDTESYYSEFKINYAATDKFRLISEFNMGMGTDVFRPGLQYLFKSKTGKIGFKLNPYRVDMVANESEEGGQIELAWRLNFLEEQFYFEGFCDINYTYNFENKYTVKAEPQIGWNYSRKTALVVEYRYNNAQFKADHGLALGAEFRF